MSRLQAAGGSVPLLRYGGENIPYEVIPSPRRRTLGIEVHPDLRVVVRAPPGYSEDEVHARVQRRAQWIDRQRSKFQRFMPRTPPRHFVAGESHRYLGRSYRLKLLRGDENQVVMRAGALVVYTSKALSPAQVQALLMRWYREKARGLFAGVLAQCFDHFERHGHPLPVIGVREMERRWGSLSTSGRMTLNLNLVKVPRACIAYVVMHELCHLEHKHHGKAFYDLLGRLMPDWERRRKKLEQSTL